MSRKEVIPGKTAGTEKHQNLLLGEHSLHFYTFYPMQRSKVGGSRQGVIYNALIRIQTLFLGQFIESLLRSILKSHSASKTITTIQSLMTVCLNLFQSLSNIIMLAMTIPAYSIFSTFVFSVSIRHQHISFD